MPGAHPIAKKGTAVVFIALFGLFLCAGVWPQDELPRPLTLKEAMRLALERNPSVAAGASELEARQASLDAQKARRQPTLRATWDWRTQESLLDGGGTTLGSDRRTTRNLSLTLSQTFYESGLSESITAARQQVQASEASLEDRRRQLLKQVAATYHTILAGQELARVAKDAVRAAEQHLEMVNARIDAGSAAPVDRLSVQAELADARYESVQTVNAVWQAIAQLQALLALPAETVPMIGEAAEIDYNLGELESWIDEALARRPDIIAQQHQVRVAELNVKQAKIAAGLSFSVVGEASYGRYTDTSGENWQIAAGASFPLHDRQAQAQVEQAQASLEVARQRLSELALSVTQEVSQAWYALRDASQRVVAAQASVEAARANLNSTQEQYAAGVAGIIEVTDAELNWRRASGQLVQARYDRSVAYYNLLASAGRLLSELEAAAPAEQEETVIE